MSIILQGLNSNEIVLQGYEPLPLPTIRSITVCVPAYLICPERPVEINCYETGSAFLPAITAANSLLYELDSKLKTGYHPHSFCKKVITQV